MATHVSLLWLSYPLICGNVETVGNRSQLVSCTLEGRDCGRQDFRDRSVPLLMVERHSRARESLSHPSEPSDGLFRSDSPSIAGIVVPEDGGRVASLTEDGHVGIGDLAIRRSVKSGFDSENLDERFLDKLELVTEDFRRGLAAMDVTPGV